MIDDKVGVALEYSGDLPRVLAIARGILFERLVRIAREHKITIYENPDLALTLSKLPVGSDIPDFLFKAVANVLAYCYKINDDFKSKMDSMGIL
jgi:type III secretion system FlhB-like substrate exporter